MNPDLSQIEVLVDYQTCNDERCIPADHSFVINLSGNPTTAVSRTIEIDEKSKTLSEALNLGVTGWNEFKSEVVSEKSGITIFFLGFLGGLIALLTPCVFPMIPLRYHFLQNQRQIAKKEW